MTRQGVGEEATSSGDKTLVTQRGRLLLQGVCSKSFNRNVSSEWKRAEDNVPERNGTAPTG